MKLSPTKKRLLNASAEIVEAKSENINYLHSIFGSAVLPYRNHKSRDYHKVVNGTEILLSSGFLMNPKTRKLELQGLPFGSKPRLLLIHLCTKAIKTKSPVIQIEDNMSAFMKSLGLRVSGGKNGSIRAFKEQLNRLNACRMQLFMPTKRGFTMANPAPIIERFDAWFPTNENQKSLWDSQVVLSEQFFKSLKIHGMPIDPRAIKALQNNSRALDTYVWLANRLPRVKGKKGDFISWQSLQHQFGGNLKELNNFRRKMLETCLLYTSPSPRDRTRSRMPSSA